MCLLKCLIHHVAIKDLIFTDGLCVCFGKWFDLVWGCGFNLQEVNGFLRFFASVDVSVMCVMICPL